MNLRRRIASGTRTQVTDFQRVRPPRGMMAASKSDFGTSRRAAQGLGYINCSTGRKGHDSLWPEGEVDGCPFSRRLSGQS